MSLATTTPGVHPSLALNGYIAFYKGQRHELHAHSQWAAKVKAVAHFKVHKRKEHEVTVVLAEKAGEPVIHTPTE